ncbi:MAG: methyl-accepting chemotaxis protein [Treponema sp.]|jgi:methyl-accepting chemotaxis protein|nr:methyl-accepting chemotaxis protein [Treponema sp.]
MRLKYKLSIIVTGIFLSGVSAIAFIALYRSTQVQLATAKASQSRLAAHQGTVVQAWYEGYLRIAQTFAGIMTEYESVEPEMRRIWFSKNMQAILESEQNLIGIFAVWKPNALDNDDLAHAGEVGATEQGQFAPYYHQYTGSTQFTVYDSIPIVEEFMAKGVSAISEPQPLRIKDKEVLTISMGVPVIHPKTGQVVAFSGVRVDIGALQGIVQDMIQNNYDIAAASVYANNGTILASFIPERIGRHFREADAMFKGHEAVVEQAISKGQPLELDCFSVALNSSVSTVFYPFTIGDTNSPWSVMIGAKQKVILEDIQNLTGFITGLAIIVGFMGALITFLTANAVTRPIVHVSKTLKDISEGAGDLTQTVAVRGNDEVADLAKYFNATMERIKCLIMVIRDQAHALSGLGNKLADHMTESAAAMNEITANIQSIKGRISYQSTEVKQSNSTMHGIIQEIHTLNSHIDRQSASMSRSSAAIEQLLANIQSVTQTLVKNTDNVNALASASEVGRSGLKEVVEDIKEIAQQSEGLLEINAVMENIASQTNLLSMNAAIEAAHAGIQGKGFAVVAEEIRKLAESSGEQSKTIGSVLKKIKDSIDKINQSTHSVLDKFEAIDKGVQIVSQQEEYLRQAMEEQNAGSKQILDTVEEVNTITLVVKASSQHMLEASREIIRGSKHLEGVTYEISEGMNEMVQGADNVNLAVHKVNELSVHNKDSITVLVKEVSKFKID